MNKSIYEFISILECPDCRGEIKTDYSSIICLECQRKFVIKDNILDMLPTKKMPLPDVYKDPNYLKVKNYETIHYMYGNPVLRRIQYSGHRMIRRLSENAELTLEIGCGTGAHHSFLNNKEKMIGLDINRARLLEFLHKEPEVPLILGDNYSLPFKSGSIPQIVSVYTLEHMYFLEKALKEIKRVLQKGGKLLVSIPSEGGLLWNLGRKFSTERYFSKKLGVNYPKYIKIEHCNSAEKILKTLKKCFILEKIVYWPTFIPSINLNLSITVRLSPRC